MDNNHQLITIVSCSSLLEQSNKFHALSISLTMSASIISLVSSLLTPLSGNWLFILLAVILLGALEIFYSIRVGFDNRLLHHLIKENITIDDKLNQLDNALAQLKLLPPDKAGRALTERLSGCLKLFKRQLTLCYLQLTAIMMAAVFSFLHS